MINIPMAIPFGGEEEAKAVYNTVKSGWLSMGKNVQEFERVFAERVGAKYRIEKPLDRLCR